MLPLPEMSHPKTSSSSHSKWQNRWVYIVLALLKMARFINGFFSKNEFENELNLEKHPKKTLIGGSCRGFDFSATGLNRMGLALLKKQ